MAKRTLTKLYRNIVETKEGLFKRNIPLPAQQRTPITFTWRGIEITVLAGPGQVINKKKAYERHMKALGRDY